MKNYLDIITDDNMLYILELITDDIEYSIYLLEIKINKLKIKLQPLQIIYYGEDGEYKHEYYTQISYNYVNYCMGKYLFKNIESNSNIVLINIYNDFFGSIGGYTFISKKLYNPTYLDILIEANKSVIITGDYHNTFLGGVELIPNNKIFRYFGFYPKKYIKYFELILRS